MRVVIVLLALVGCVTVGGQDLLGSAHCPAGCRCTAIKPKGNSTQSRQSYTDPDGSRSSRGGSSDVSGGMRVRCGDVSSKVAALAELDTSLFPRDTRQLDLGGNLITDVPRAGFAHLPLLQKLDLRDNLISHLAPESFYNLTSLRRLDLSGNKLTRLSGGVFLGLEKLANLRLSQNQLTSIAEGTFDDLIALVNLDLSGNPLHCDCHLSWLVDWLRNESIKLSDGSQCASPPQLLGQELGALPSSSLLCRPLAPLQITLEMHPDTDQVVFERDSVRLTCVVMGTSRSSVPVTWLWQDHKDPTYAFPDIIVDSRFIADQAATVNSLNIGPLTAEHSGRWECRAANLSYSISLLVISSSTQFCPQTVTSGNKGSYLWPRSVVGLVVELPCVASPPALLTGSLPLAKGAATKPLAARATHACGQDAVWQQLNTSACAFLSNTTKTLEQLSKLNLVKAVNALQSAQWLRNFTREPQNLVDRMDIVFLAKTVENHLEFITREKELGGLLVGVVGSVTSLPSSLLAEAQVEDSSCQRLVDAAEAVAEHSPLTHSQPGLAVEGLRVSRDSFQGVTCVWYADPAGLKPRLFHCSSNERSLPTPAALQDMELVGSVQLPASLFAQLPRLPGSKPSPQLLVSMFSNAHLFPETNVSKSWGVTSCVVGCKLVGSEGGQVANSLTSAPVWVTMQAPLDSAARPVVWDGHGGWSEEGCTFSRTLGSLLVFQCTRLGYYALKQDLVPPLSAPLGPPPLPSRASPPGLYAGSLLLGSSLLIAMATYVACHRDLRMPAKTKHSLVNTWLAMVLLSLTFSCGIHQTGNVPLCQVVGLALHYLSLCSLLWMAVTLSNLHKQLTSGEGLTDDEEEPPGDLPVPPQPMLGFYLVGWGIALIICGISGAVNLRHYAGASVCFLSPAASVSAVLVPGGAVLTVLALLWLLAHCAAARHTAESGRISQGTQATERVDLELLGPRLPSPCRSSSSSSNTSEQEDAERSPRSQLLAHLAVLVLFLSAWACGVATVAPLTVPHQTLIFSSLHAVSCAALGAFILAYFCLGRKDVTAEWKLARHPADWWCSGSGKGKPLVIANSTCGSLGPQPLPPREPPASPLRAPPSLSALTSAVAPPALQLLDDFSEDLQSKSCLNEEEEEDRVEAELLEKVFQLRASMLPGVLPPASVVTEGSVSGTEHFYNPHQLGVARKFFRRQRLMKRNNAAAAAATSCAATSDAESLFSTGSKVNNNNFHTATPHNKLNNRVNRDPNLMPYPSDFTKQHHNVFERPRAHSPLSSVSEARAARVRRPPRARSADELGERYEEEVEISKEQRRHRTRKRHRRGGRGARVHESSLASVTSLRAKPPRVTVDSAGDSDAKKETCV